MCLGLAAGGNARNLVGEPPTCDDGSALTAGHPSQKCVWVSQARVEARGVPQSFFAASTS